MTDTTQPPAETLAATYEPSEAEVLAARLDESIAFKVYSSSDDHIRDAAAMLRRLSALTRRAGGDAIPAGEEWPVKWAGPLTVGNMIANLRTLPADMPLHSAYHLVREGKPARLFVKHPTVSRERVDGREIKTGDESVPYSAVIWSHGREPEIATPKPPAGGDVGAVERAYRQGQIDMRDRAAAVCDERGAEEQEGYGLNRAAQNYFRARNAVRALELAALALPAPVMEGDSPYVAGPIWAEEEDDCFTAEIQISGGHYVVATVHGGTRDQVEQRQRAIIAALSEGRSHG